DFGGRDIDPAVLVTPEGIGIRLQVLNKLGYPAWPVELIELEQRYSDVDSAHLYVPTVESFVASKTTAWFDRRAARDLYDLWALAERGHITADAAALFVDHGPTHSPPKSFMFDQAPSEQEWTAQLAGQTRLTVTAAE